MKTLICYCLGLILYQGLILHVIAQDKITLTHRNSYSEIFKEIEKQTEYRFFYNTNQIDLNYVPDISPLNNNIQILLNELFKNTSITYTIRGNHIVLTNKSFSIQKVIESKQPILFTINGKITDLLEEPLEGAYIQCPEIPIQTITNKNGEFTIQTSVFPLNLHISYLGYLEKSITIKDGSYIHVILMEDIQKLEETVVIGYGSFVKQDLTSSITQIKGTKISSLVSSNVANALQGKAAGVNVQSTSGTPGSVSTVRIRGLGTLYDNTPLYVVDGLPQYEIGWLNIREVESIEILKDASASSIYGSRGANGVILITTKKGHDEGMYEKNMEFNMSTSFQQAPKRYKMLDAEGFMEYKNRAYNAAGKDLMSDFSSLEKREQILFFLEQNGNRHGTDWWQEMNRPLRKALLQNYYLALSGGIPFLKYRASVDYTDHQGILIGSDYNRLAGRINLENEIKKGFQITANIHIIKETSRNLQENNAYSGTIFNTITADPITPVYRSNLIHIPDFLTQRIMEGYKSENPWSKYAGVIYSNKQNPVAQAQRLSLNKLSVIQNKNSFSGNLTITPELTFKSAFSLDIYRGVKEGFNPIYYLDPDEYSTYTTITRETHNSDYWVFDNYLNFHRKTEYHNFNIMVGTSAEKSKYEEIIVSKDGIHNDPNLQVINAGTLNPYASGYHMIHTLNSYFSRIFYSLRNKYLFTLNLRWDGSSSFAKGNRWGFFPSASAAWNFTEETFLSRKLNGWNGKLRISWGQTGNQKMNNTLGAYLTKYTHGEYYLFGKEYELALSGGKNYVGNPDLTWETNQQMNIGFEFISANQNLRIGTDYFYRNTKNMLVQIPSPSVIGLPNNPWSNAGSVSNNGLELSWEYKHTFHPNFQWELEGNISTYKNRVIHLGNNTNIPGKEIHLGNQTYTMTEPGKPIGYYYGFKTDGIFQTQEEIDNYIYNGIQVMPGAKPGDLKFIDFNQDGKLDDQDRRMLGSPHPAFIFGCNWTGIYKNFDFSFFIQGSVGNKILNILKYDIYSGTGWYNAPSDILTSFWDGAGSTNKNFSIDANSRMNLEMSDWFIENGSYARIKNIQLGYTIPSGIVGKFGIYFCRLFISASNVFTFTSYSSLDPEIGEYNNNPLYTGIDMGFYPQPRIFQFGINLHL